MVTTLTAALAAFIHLGVVSVADERVLSLAQLARRLPRHRKDRPVHPSTIHRWRNPGVRGVRLECLRIGGIWHTSLEAFQRFCEALSSEPRAQDSSARPDQAAAATQAAHQDRIEQQLRDLGA